VTVIFDACSLINLTNGQVLSHVLQLGDQYVVGPIVSGEVGLEEIERALGDGQVFPLDDSQLNAEDFLALVEEHRLGDGESECILAARQFGYTVCTDDGKARELTTKLLGASRLTGSLGLLRRAVSKGILKIGEAYNAYQRMISAGAFLPRLPSDFFTPRAPR
jgi:predicted nucleic acid-binding protein